MHLYLILRKQLARIVHWQSKFCNVQCNLLNNSSYNDKKNSKPDEQNTATGDSMFAMSSCPKAAFTSTPRPVHHKPSMNAHNFSAISSSEHEMDRMWV